MRNRFVSFIITHYQFLISLYLFTLFLGWAVYQIVMLIRTGSADYVEISFIIQNIILSFIVVCRKPHVSVDRNPLHQLVALIAFFSGAAFMGQPQTGGETAMLVSSIIIIASNVLGIMTLLSLGRSFGILIALREVRTDWLYSLIRHPMYFTDILLRIGFLVSHFNPFTAAMAFISIVCYGYRAVLEERHLSSDTKYRSYMKRVRYRFIPFVF
jgi:protein-S-isoprenylcysteine O-methyltransferase Ste14